MASSMAMPLAATSGAGRMEAVDVVTRPSMQTIIGYAL